MAVATARSLSQTIRALGRGGGQSLPGEVALKIDPKLLRRISLGLPDGVVLITGTNGKTTTAGLVDSVLRTGGRRVVNNASGANLLNGITMAAAAAVHRGRIAAEVGVFEVDELWFGRLVEETSPRVVAVLNLFRDQLDRSGELEATAARIGSSLRAHPSSLTIANADDSIVMGQLNGRNASVTFGIESQQHTLPELPHIADGRVCPLCGAVMHFSSVVLGHCGHYRCPNGDFARPSAKYQLTNFVDLGLDHMKLQLGDGSQLQASLGGVYNAYNVLAAYAICRELGVPHETVAQGIAAFRPRFGRQEVFELFGRQMRLLLAKNPAGFDEVIRTADEFAQPKTVVIAINDLIADGRDVSWLWDVDFERFSKMASQPQVVVTGRRAADMAVRLKYAGIDTGRVLVEPDFEVALQRAAEDTEDGNEVLIFPTYTAMLALRKVAEKWGAVQEYWKQR
jgi:UDP-N-acetylmuramyl tripeptide synthase